VLHQLEEEVPSVAAQSLFVAGNLNVAFTDSYFPPSWQRRALLSTLDCNKIMFTTMYQDDDEER
jgi:hypothetical protein